MDVKIYPFSIFIQLDNRNGLSKDGFMSYLTGNSNNRDTIYEKERVIVLQNIPNIDYIAGVLLSFRDYDAHCKVVPNGRGGYSATIETIEDGAEYNFFIVNKRTLKGVWLTYFNAASISVLDKILKNMFDKYSRVNGIDVDRKFKLKNKIKANMIISGESLNEALSRFNHIHSVEFTEVNKEQHSFTPDTINIKKTKILLKKDSVLDNIKDSIENLYRSGDAENISVAGNNTYGKSERINLDAIFRPWLTYDYDEITRSLQDFDTNNLLEHEIIAKLTKCIENNTKYKRTIENL